MSRDLDGSILLTTDAVADLLVAAVQHAGGRLISWQLDHVDSAPNHSTTATYFADVQWPNGRRTELLGVSARVGAPTSSDANAEIFVDGDREVAVWVYPNDPDLPGLKRAAYPARLVELINERDLVSPPAIASEAKLTMVGYRPRRRAVVRLAVGNPESVFYVKVLRPRVFDDIVYRHRILLDAGVPGPEVAATTTDQLLVLRELPGMPLARAIFKEEHPTEAEDLINLLDSMPSAVAGLDRRAPWADSIGHYANIVAQALPGEAPRLDWLSTTITQGLADIPLGNEPTHGDFHEGQLHVAGGRVVGMLDVDTIGPGRRADDLACLIAHLSTIQGMNAQQAQRVRNLLARWVPVFDERVDPFELRLRAAAVIVSLATGPYRAQEPQWEAKTSEVIGAAVALVRQVV